MTLTSHNYPPRSAKPDLGLDPKPTAKPVAKLTSGHLPTALAVATLALALTLAWPTGQAQAACDCGTLSQIVRSAAERIVTGLASSFDASVKEAANYETQNLHKDLVALREAVLMGDETIAKAIETADGQAAERDFEKTFDLSSQPSTSCGDDDMGGELMLSKGARTETGTEIMEKLLERRSRHGRNVDYLTELADFPPPEKTPALLGALSAGRTLTLEEVKEAERLLESMTDPMPLPKLPENRSQTAAGRLFEAERTRHEARQNLFQSVLAQRLADRAPTVEGLSGWAENKWLEMGGTGEVPGLTEGRLSQEALFWLLTNARLASGNWHEEILPKLPEAGLLRELASMMAVELELSRQRNDHLGNISALLALDGLSRLESGPGQSLRAQYRRALSGDK